MDRSKSDHLPLQIQSGGYIRYQQRCHFRQQTIHFSARDKQMKVFLERLL